MQANRLAALGPWFGKFWGVVCLLMAVAAVTLSAQTCLAADEEPPTVAEPEDITLPTKDYVQLKCTWYPGALGKKSIPVLMIHGWEGQRTDYEALALSLQKRGCAVLVPDLRGHGGSVRQKAPGLDEKTLKKESFKATDIQDMVDKDLAACKKFLTEKNNAGELNIELLCVVGAELGGFLATAFTEQDYSYDQLPAYKIGRDVRALVLIAPAYAYRGSTLQKTLITPLFQKKDKTASLSLMLICGKDDKTGLTDTLKFNNALAKFYPIPKEQEDQRKNQDFFFMKLDTSLPGAKIIKEQGLGLDNMIGGFVNLRLQAKQEDHPWTDRPSPTGN